MIFWLIAFGMAGYLAVIVATGQICTRQLWRSVVWADRRTGPRHYWLCVGVLSLIVIAAFYQAIWPPY
jgi:hypothetical protein